ncbi:arsenite methyltransferase [Methanococcoides sp. FTZ1]|uniref:arsenite methyltransferase n=1 Tax=Methanococcoides sp. FTZ1 TaxID=3439061 RepID=UPI003F840087
MDTKDVKKMVKENYAEIARDGVPCCSMKNSCCNPGTMAVNMSRKVGYSDKDLQETPEGANLGLGCGNPTALASLRSGEYVLDLGSGAGFDCFLAAGKVGPGGKVIGVDMTPEMIEKARMNASNGGYTNVEFRSGDIEELPVEDNSIDVVISNCVINLAPSKAKVFSEIFRVLRKGGRFIISDIVLLSALPEKVKDSVEAYVGCIAGAILKEDYLDTIKNTGFDDIRILKEVNYPSEMVVAMLSADETPNEIPEEVGITLQEAEELAESVISIEVYGRKPV